MCLLRGNLICTFLVHLKLQQLLRTLCCKTFLMFMKSYELFHSSLKTFFLEPGSGLWPASYKLTSAWHCGFPSRPRLAKRCSSPPLNDPWSGPGYCTPTGRYLIRIACAWGTVSQCDHSYAWAGVRWGGKPRVLPLNGKSWTLTWIWT